MSIIIETIIRDSVSGQEVKYNWEHSGSLLNDSLTATESLMYEAKQTFGKQGEAALIALNQEAANLEKKNGLQLEWEEFSTNTNTKRSATI